MNLQEAMVACKAAGFEPGINSRGIQWRAHLNVAKSTWDDVNSLAEATVWFKDRLREHEQGKVFP